MKLFKNNVVPYASTEGDKIYPIVVDIKKGIKSGEAISFVTADNQVGVITIDFMDGNSSYNIEGCMVTSTIHRPDGTVLEIPCDIISQSTIEIPLGVNGTYQEGVHTFDLKIFRDSGKIIGVPTMNYVVHESLSSDDYIEEEDKLPIISNLTNEVLRLNGEWDAFTDKFGDIDWEEMQGTGANSVTVNGTKYTQVDGNIALPNYPTLSSLGAEPKNSNIQAHIASTHAPSNAQKNSDITKAEIEAKLVGNITTHTHNQYLTQHQDLSHLALKTELHNHGNKSVLDNITSAKVTEWNNKSTFSGSYKDLTNKPTIPTKVSELTNDSGYLKSIPSEYVTETELATKGYLTEHQDISHLANKSELHNHTNKAILDGITSTKITEWNNKSTFSGSYNDLTNKPIIPSIEGLATEDFVKNEIAKIDTSIDIVDSVEDMIDTSKQYVYSKTNTWWKYKNVTIPAGGVLPSVDNAIKWNTTQVSLNKRLNSSSKEVDALGCAIFYFTFDDEMKNILNTIDPVWIRMKGCSMYATSGNNTSTKVVTWKSDGTIGINCTPCSQILMHAETKDGISDTPYPSSWFNYGDNKIAPITASKFGYMNTTTSDDSTNKRHDLYLQAIDGKLALSLIVNFASTTAITEEDLKDVYITFNEPIVTYEEIVTEGWYDTGMEYNPNDDSSVVDLGVRVSELEGRVGELEKRPIGGGNTTTSTLPSYWENRLDEISPKIDALQKEYGVDAFQFMWASDIHSVPGSSPNNTTYIGEIGRYMMDKHNIPFFTISGDIMSQASHSNVETIWTEYDKLNNMFSPIRNDEFLATKGNHDGAWGSPVDGVYYLNNIGTKELFNAIYRRQTLDRNRVFGKDGTYFYVDCPNVRFYMLNTHTDGDSSKNSDGSAVYNPMKHFVLGNEQLNWIANSLLTVQEGQKVIFMGHAPIKACIDGSIFTGILTSYKNRNNYEGTTNITGTYWGTNEKYSKVSVNKDFTSAKGDLVGYFHGHIHRDTITVDGAYPIISITTAGGDLRDEYLTNGTLTRVNGTPTETAIDLVTVTSDYIYFTRIGSGYDRKYNRLTKEITIDYDSAYKPPTDGGGEDGGDNSELTQGEITSEVTWQENTRLSSSSGGYSAYDNVYASSDINVKNGDVIRIYGFTWDNGYRYVNAYNQSTFLINVDIHNGNTQTTNYFDVNVVSDNVLEVTIKHDNVTHVRVCCYSITPPTIRVFKNMELDINNLVIPNPTNTTDTSIWVNGYRFSSSGLAIQEGTSVSNKIQIKKGDTIKISGVTLRENQDRLCVNITTSGTGEDVDALGYFNIGVLVGGAKAMSYKGYADGVYTFFVESEYTGTINYFRFAMPTPTNFSKVKVIREGTELDITYTNQIPLSIASDGTPFNGGQGWKTGYRISLSGGGESEQAGCECTGFIRVPNYNAVIRLKNVGTYSTDAGSEGHYGIVGYDKDFNKLPNNGVQLSTITNAVSEDGVVTLHGLGWASHFANNALAYVRISSTRIDSSSIITVNEPIE